MVKPKKPPAGAVSMFGGLPPSALLKRKEQSDDSAEPTETAAPQPKAAAKTGR